MDDPWQVPTKILQVPFSYLVCSVLLLKSTMSQTVVPGHIPVAYLTSECTSFALTGLHKLSISSQAGYTYKPDMDCTLYLSLNGPYVLHFTFDHLDIQSDLNGDCTDYIQLFNGHGEQTELTPKLCGKIPPQPIISNTTEVALRFRTNGTRQHSGFKLKYESIRKSKLDTMGCTRKTSSCGDQLNKAGNCATQTTSGTSLVIATLCILGGLLGVGS